MERNKARLRQSGRQDPRTALAALAVVRLGLDDHGCRKAFFTLARWSLGQIAEDWLRQFGYAG